MNIKPTIYYGHLPYPWAQHWRVGSWTLEVVGGGGVKQNVLERGGSEHFVFTSWLIGAFD